MDDDRHPRQIWACKYGNTIAAEMTAGPLDGDGVMYVPATALAAAQAEIARLREEASTLRCALITWRNVMEGGNHGGLCVAYEIGNDALGVPPELRTSPEALRRAVAGGAE